MSDPETAIPERLVVLSCPWEHRHLWPADVEPYPRECMAKVASLPNGEWPTCGKHLHVSRYVTPHPTLCSPMPLGGIHWSICEICGVPIFRHHTWSHEGGTPPQDHDAEPCENGGEGATVRCKRCGGSPVVAEVEGRTLVCATCRDDAEFRAHAREDYR